MVVITLILSIIEGLTEFIPVSSTAHILLASRALAIQPSAFIETVSICIQSGAIFAAIWYFWNTIWGNISLIPKIALAFIPTGIAGVLLYPLIKPLFASPLVMALALILGGIGLIYIKPVETNTDIHTLSYKQAFLIGLAQIASFIPGVSRAGATLIGGTLLHIPRSHIVAFSFLLGIPTILGASVVELRHTETMSSYEWTLIALGTFTAFVVARYTMQFFITLLTKKPLSWFGWYRIALGVLVLILLT